MAKNDDHEYMHLDDLAFEPVEVAPITPRIVTLAASAVVTVLLVFVMLFVPAPYLVQLPGPALNVLGTVTDPDADADLPGAHHMITITGAPTYPTADGALLLTSVSAFGSPGHKATPLQVLRDWWRSDRAITPIEQFYPRGVTRDDVQQNSAGQMLTSQDHAALAALDLLGYEVGTEVIVIDVLEDSPAADIIKEHDVIITISSADVAGLEEVADVMGTVTGGDTIEVVVMRNGDEVTLEVPTRNDDGRAMMGILISEQAVLPIEVDFELNNIGGPSAGMMFALGIVDLLTEEDELAGAIIAGTGTINQEGEVGTIGGIRQKLHGARNAGAEFFLAPEGNCEETIGNEPSGLQVISVTTLQEAYDAVVAIGQGETEHLTTCAAAVGD